MILLPKQFIQQNSTQALSWGSVTPNSSLHRMQHWGLRARPWPAAENGRHSLRLSLTLSTGQDFVREQNHGHPIPSLKNSCRTEKTLAAHSTYIHALRPDNTPFQHFQEENPSCSEEKANFSQLCSLRHLTPWNHTPWRPMEKVWWWSSTRLHQVAGQAWAQTALSPAVQL